MCMCVCVCVWDNEYGLVWGCVFERVHEKDGECVCVWESERKHERPLCASVRKEEQESSIIIQIISFSNANKIS